MTSDLPMPDCDRPAFTRAGSMTVLGRIANFVPAAACVFAALGMAVAYFVHPQGVPPSLMRVQLAIVVVATLAVLISAVLETKRSHAAMVANGTVLQAMMAALPFPLFALGPGRDVHACNQAALKTFR